MAILLIPFVKMLANPHIRNRLHLTAIILPFSKESELENIYLYSLYSTMFK